MIELLSPGGNLEKIKFAVVYGADAVYCALKKFGLRSRAGNLTEDEYIKALEFVHTNKKKLYLALNAYLFDRDFEALKVLIDFINKFKPDGVIVSDLGVLNLINKNTDIPIHISTQANITNSYAANLLSGFNVRRIVLARELTLDDIKHFRESTELELEVFVHGAMCMAYSGRCFMSAYLAERSANRGDCAQSCRWEYTIVEKKRPEQPFYVEENPEGTFIFNSYDMCAIPILPEIIKAGINSIKIEGRMKSVYYTSITTAVYRDAIDTIVKGEDFYSKLPYYMRELEKVSHRPYSLGFYLGSPKQHVTSSGYMRSCKFCGVVVDYNDGLAKVQLRDRIEPGEYEFVRPLAVPLKITIKSMVDESGNEKIYGNPNEFVYIRVSKRIENFALLRRCNESNSGQIKVQKTSL